MDDIPRVGEDPFIRQGRMLKRRARFFALVLAAAELGLIIVYLMLT